MKLFFSVTLFVVFTTLNAQPVKWHTFEEATKLNEKEPRNILIDVYTDWCTWCKIMDKQTFSKAHIANILNKQFYAVKFNAETLDTIRFDGKIFINEKKGVRSPHNLAIALLQGKMSYPNIVFLNKENQLLGALPGFKKPDAMEAILDYIHKELYKKNIDLGGYIDSFNKEKVQK